MGGLCQHWRSCSGCRAKWPPPSIALATFDFYEPHYYDNEGDRGSWSVFHHAAAYWQVDKPIVIGEFYTRDVLDVLGQPVAPKDMCRKLVELGYAGGWPWQWNEFPEEIKACLRAMQVTRTSD